MTGNDAACGGKGEKWGEVTEGGEGGPCTELVHALQAPWCM